MINRKTFLILSPIAGLGFLALTFIAVMHVIGLLSDFPGYRGGQQDAFRHALASAYTSKYLSPSIVDIFTKFSEKDLNSSHDKMDIHNNSIGKKIGMTADNVYQRVREKVIEGQENAVDAETITWLSPEKWSNFLSR